MSVARWVKSHRRSAASLGIVTAAAVALGIMAFSYEGFTTTDVDLHDGGVWVTRTDQQQLARLNVQAQELDGGFFAPSADFDVLQSGANILLHDAQGSSLGVVQAATMDVGAAVTVPAGASVALGGTTVAIMNASGDLWLVPFEQLPSFSAEDVDPVAELGEGAAVAVGLDGSAYAASVEHASWFEWPMTDEGLGDEQSRRGDFGDATRLTLTVVGDRAVALDEDAGRLYLPGSTVDVPEGAVLQQPGDGADRVVLATNELLIRQPIGGGAPDEETQGDGSGDAVAPVQLNGCVYGVWPASTHFVRDCAFEANDLDVQVEDMDGSPVVFRVNRGNVVLNQVAEGKSWLITDQMVLVDNWDEVFPPPSEEHSEETDESTEDVLSNQPPPPTAENNPPVAVDDSGYGVRPGRATSIPVLDNDSDQDGDILTASVVGEVPDGVTISPITNDSELQVEIADGYAGDSFAFRYKVDDGRGGTAEATVSVPVRGQSDNTAPATQREQTFQVEQGATYEYSALMDWFDADGDDFYLEDAKSASGDTVQFSPSGRIVYTATGVTGLTSLEIVVSDGTDSRTATIAVDVRERGTAEPTANGDYVSTVPGLEAQIRPLLNDFAPSGNAMRLASATAPAGLQIDWNAQTGIVRIVDGTVGTHYIDYIMAVDAASASGRIRVDIREVDDEARPVAVRDLGLLPRQGETLIDLLANDVDPSGGVLVVQSITGVDGAPLTVELLERRTLRVVDNRGMEGPFTLQYSVSNGRHTETGQVVIVPVEPPAQPRTPVAVDDQAVVREGDYVTVDITDNDFSPDNTPFEVAPELVESSLASDAEGVAFIDGDVLRVHVLEGGPSRVTVSYEVVDAFAQRDSATVTIQVVPRDPEVNDPPSPRPVTSRVLAGSRVRIPIPLNGIDPNGDGVQLVGPISSPDGGRIVETGPNYFDFEAFPESSGTVSFEYSVRDRWNGVASAGVVIGIAQPADMNQTPFADTDARVVRPGRAIAVPVLDNDSDPDGDLLALPEGGLTLGDGVEEASVNAERNTVDVVAPEEPGDYFVTYTLQDARGASTTGTVTLTVDPNAPLVAPIAVDDIVAQEDLVAGETFDVPVLENDSDGDGSPDDLDVSVVTGDARVVADGAVQVQPAELFQVVTYRVSDVDGQNAEAFVFVPAATARPPFVTSTEPIVVGSGETVQIPLREYVTVSTSNEPRITTEASVSATEANGEGLVVDERTLQYTSRESYRGPASISFDVTDGTSPEDPAGQVAHLTIPITVIASSRVAPEWDGAIVDVVQGEEATEYNLRLATRDPDEGDLDGMQYRLLGGEMAGVTVDVRDQVFAATAMPDAQAGASGSFQIEIRDPAGNVIQGTVVVRVVLSNRPLTLARPDAAEGNQGTPITVDVIQNDVNPFQDRGEPLTVTGAAVIGGEGSAPTTDGRSVTVTPGASFSGILTVQYTVQDATRSTQRQVTGTVTITVKGRPDAPVRPNVDAVGDGQVTLTWAPPGNNGAPITGYIVRSAQGTQQACPSTTCTITGLTNNTPYTFSVTAVNEVGESDPSPASAEARPDVRPDPPGTPVATRGDTFLDIAWAPAVTRGSPITQYVLEVTPPVGGQTSVIVQGNQSSYRWAGLVNGTAYSFRVQAFNSAPEPSDPSGWSSPAIPAGPPLQVQNVQASRTSVAERIQVTVTWSVPGNNGSAIQKYRVNALRDGVVEASQPAEGAQATSATFEGSVGADGSAYTFTVEAFNDVGWSPVSAASAPIRAVTTPAAPTIALVSDGDGQSVVAVTPGATNGARASEVTYHYTVDSGALRGPVGAGNQTISMANKVGGHRVVFYAVSVVDGVRYQSPASNAITATPSGIPPAPSVGADAQVGGVTVSWAPNGTNGRNLAHIRWTTTNGGQPQQVPATSGSQTINAQPGQEVCISAVVVDDLGRDSAEARKCATALGQPRIWLTKGAEQRDGGCQTSSGGACRYYMLNWENLKPGDYTFQCYHSNNSSGQPLFESGTIRVGATNGQTQSRKGDTQPSTCFNGFSGDAWFTLSGGPTGSIPDAPRVPWP